MTFSPAPFYQHDNHQEAVAEAYWLHSDDDVRLRISLWRTTASSCGTILLFPGRTEYVEKYAAVAHNLTAEGMNVLAIDWRGQGMADRLQENPRTSHIDDFAQYQLDVLAMVEAAAGLSLPEPWHLLAHSMGGAIGLAALHNGLPVETATFSAPMWGINHSPMPRAVAMALVSVANRFGRGGSPAIGTGGDGTYVLDEPFRTNLLTGNSTAWVRLLQEAEEWPELTLGGASYQWIGQALTECRRLSKTSAPDLPVLVALGTNERIVSAAAVHEYLVNWPDSKLLMVEGGRHEIMLETPERQHKFYSAFMEHIQN